MAKKRSKARFRYKRPPEFEGLMPELGAVREPRTRHDQMMEMIDGMFMFEGFPGFFEACLNLEKQLIEWGVSPSSKAGQRLLAEFVDHVEKEFYGDFDGDECSSCGEYVDNVSIKRLNIIIERHECLCGSCAKTRTRRVPSRSPKVHIEDFPPSRETLKKLRAKGMTLRDLSNHFGVSVGTLDILVRKYGLYRLRKRP